MSQYDDPQRTIRTPRDENMNSGGPLSPRVERTQVAGWGAANQRPDANQRTQLIRTGPPTFAWLVLVKGPGAGQLFRLRADSDGNLIGRGEDCDIPLDDPSVSKTHAKVRADGEENGRPVFFIQDMMSTNKTLVNGEEVVRTRLHDSDYVSIGHLDLVFKQV